LHRFWLHLKRGPPDAWSGFDLRAGLSHAQVAGNLLLAEFRVFPANSPQSESNVAKFQHSEPNEISKVSISDT
jgi:hypothetical protein